MKNIKIDIDNLLKIKKFIPDVVLQQHKEHVDEIQKIAKFIASNSDHDLISVLLNYSVIRNVSTMEYLFKQMASGLIDTGLFPIPDMPITTTSKDLREIQKTDAITLGVIITNEINFQKLESINNIYSIFFNVDFFREIEKKEKINWDLVAKLINTRHEIVHEGKNFLGSILEYLNMALALSVFLENALVVCNFYMAKSTNR